MYVCGVYIYICTSTYEGPNASVCLQSSHAFAQIPGSLTTVFRVVFRLGDPAMTRTQAIRFDSDGQSACSYVHSLVLFDLLPPQSPESVVMVGLRALSARIHQLQKLRRSTSAESQKASRNLQKSGTSILGRMRRIQKQVTRECNKMPEICKSQSL